MKVFGLHASVYRGASLASRLQTAAADTTLARRHDALARWHAARRHGLSAAQAAQAVGVSRASLYRWQKHPQRRSRRPHHTRPTTWRGTPLVEQVEALRQRYPMWGKRKIAVILRRQGKGSSISTVGRILHDLIGRRRITPVPLLRRMPGPCRFRRLAEQRHAKRLPKGLKPAQPGELVQLDTLFVNVAPRHRGEALHRL